MDQLINFDYNESDSDNDTDTETTESEHTDFSDNDSNEDDEYTCEYDVNFQINKPNNFINKNILLIPEIHNRYFHGKTVDSDPNIDGQFLVLQSFYLNPTNKLGDFFKYANNLCKFYKKYYKKNYYERVGGNNYIINLIVSD